MAHSKKHESFKSILNSDEYPCCKNIVYIKGVAFAGIAGEYVWPRVHKSIQFTICLIEQICQDFDSLAEQFESTYTEQSKKLKYQKLRNFPGTIVYTEKSLLSLLNYVQQFNKQISELSDQNFLDKYYGSYISRERRCTKPDNEYTKEYLSLLKKRHLEMASKLQQSFDRIIKSLETQLTETRKAVQIDEQKTKNETLALKTKEQEEARLARECELRATKERTSAELEKQRLSIEKERLQKNKRELDLKEEEAGHRLRAEMLQQQKLAEQMARTEADKKALDSIKRASDIPLRYYLDFLEQKFKEIAKDELDSANHSKLLDLYRALTNLFKENGLIEPERLETVSSDVHRLNQIETLIDLYSEKMRKVRNDPNLDEEERELKLEYWVRLRDRDIAELEK